MPVLAVLVSPVASPALASRARDYHDWTLGPPRPEEIATRLLRLISQGQTTTIDPRFLALMVHDLRTPLNVIGLTIRALSQSMPVKSADFEEDLTFLQDNARQIEKMLAQLGDFCRLLEIETAPVGVEFDFCRFLSDFVEDRSIRGGIGNADVRLELNGPCPREVSLDPNRARMALQHVVANAITAAGDGYVRIELGGVTDRIRLAVIVDRPPPVTVVNTELRADLYERLAGSAAERRGLDLAIAAGISALFGGSARLEVEPEIRSTIVLDWPARLSGT